MPMNSMQADAQPGERERIDDDALALAHAPVEHEEVARDLRDRRVLGVVRAQCGQTSAFLPSGV